MKKMIKSLIAAIGVALMMTGSTFAAEAVTIGDVEALKAFAAAVNSGTSYEGDTVTLSADLDLTDVEWTPIGVGTRSSKSYTGNAFKGTFDGGNHTISGLTITSTESDDAAVGLFGVVDGGTVKNLKLDAVNINVASSDLAGGAIGLMVNNAKAENITVGGSIVGNDGVGGIVGRLIISGTISSCTNNASVTSSYGGIGGIVGKAYYEDGANTALFASVDKCVNNGIITAPMYMGGIVGLARANVTGCINNGVVVGGTQTGGIVGQLIAAGTVSNNENNAKISGKNHLGGIIGDYSQSTAYTYYNVTIANNINRGELAATEQCAAILGCNNIDGFTAMTASGNVSFYYAEGLVLFGNPEDMVIDSTNMFNPAMTLSDFVQKVVAGNGVFDGNGATVQITPVSGDARTETKEGLPDRLQKYTNPEVYYAQYQRFGDLTDVFISNVKFVFVPAAVTVVDAWNTAGATTTADNINGELQLLNTGNVTLTGCSFDKMSVSPINATAVSVSACSFNGLDAYAIKDIKASTVTVADTTFTDCNGGFWMNAAPAVLSVTGNTFANVGRRGAIQFSANGDYSSAEMTVTDNTVTGGAFLWLLNPTVTYEQVSAILDTTKNTYDTAYVSGSTEPKPPVAKIDETTYATLEAAFAAATEGQTITLLMDATPALTSQRAITKAAIVDLGGNTLTLTEDDLYFGTTTFKNGTIVVGPSVKPSTAVFWMFADQTLTFDNVKVVATGVTGTYLIGLDGNNSDLNLLNGSEIFVDNTTALDLDIICVNASTGNDIVIDNSKVNVTNLDGRVLFRGNYTIKGTSEINLAGITKAGIRIEAGQTLSIEDTAKVIIAGEPRDGGIHLTDATATYTKADTAQVTATVNRPAIAKIGDTPYYTLAEAVAAAQAGDEIVLLADATVEGTLALPAGIKLTSNGKTIDGSIRMLGDLELNGPLTITGGLWVGKSGETLTATLSGGKLTANYFMFQRGTYTINADIDAVYGYLSFEATFEVNSTIHTTGANGEVLYINGNVTLNDGAVLDSDNSVFVCNDNAVLTLKAGSKVDSNVKITTSGAKVYIDATGMTAGTTANITGTVTNSGNGAIAVVGNDKLEASIVDGKIVLAAKPVAKIGDTNYTTLADAVAALKANGGTLKLLADVNESITFNYPAAGAPTEITVDLNGFTVTSAESTLWVSDGYVVTVKDSSDAKTGKIISTSAKGEAIAITRNGHVILESGYIYNDFCAVWLYNATGNGSFVMNGGTLEVPNDGQTLSVGAGKATINGGKILCNKVPNGGGWNTYVYQDGTLVITGGEFLGTIGNYGKTAVSGGTFSYPDDPNDGFREEHLASGYATKVNADGSITVYELPTSLQGTGTAEDPFLINNIDDLKLFRNLVNSGTRYNGQYVKLTADIDLNDEEWTPIGDRNVDQGSFLGTFDGDNHTISNLWISEWTKTGAGFFSKVGLQTEYVSGTVRNLTFNNVTIVSSESYVGVIAQAPSGALIENVHVTGDITISGYGYVGGIVGHGYPTINNSSVVGNTGSTITANYWGAGAILGFAGDYGAKISNATVEGVKIHANYGGAASVAGSPYGAALDGASVKNVEITSNSDYCMGYVSAGGNLSNVTIENVTATANGQPITPADAKASIGDTVYFSLSSAISSLKDGDTLTIYAGEISEGTIKFPASLKNVMIKGRTGAVLKDMTLMACDGSNIAYEGITFDGIVFDNSNILFSGQRASASFKDWTIANCEFKNVSRGNAAISFNLNASEAMENFTFTNNVIDGVTGGNYSGLVLRASKGNVVISGNDIKNVVWNAVQLINSTADTLTIEDNRFASGADEGILNLYGVTAATLTIKENQFLVAENQPGVCYIECADVSLNYWGGDAPANLPSGVTFSSYYTTVEDGVLGGLVELPKGTLTNCYTSATGYWGECGGNAKESFVFKFYNDDTYMGYTSLNNVGGIIDGDVNVSWNIKLDAASNTDEYWTMAWEVQPTLAMQPNRCEQWVDGVKVAECAVEPNWSDRIFPVVAAVTDEKGQILSYVNNHESATMANAVANGGYVTLLADVKIDASLDLPADKTLTLDLNGKKISGSAVLNNAGDLTIRDSSAEKDATNELAIVNTGKLAISSGHFAGAISGEGEFAITGGTYVQNVADYCAEGYLCAEQNCVPVLWKVGRLPSAEVINLGPVEVGPEGDFTFGDNYYVYDLVGTQKMTTSTEPFDLQIALNFIAKDTVTQAEKNAFGNYTTDFYITIDDIADGSFVADEDCYLAGYYPSFNAWVKIPLTGFEIVDGKVYPVITSAGFDFKYTDICGSVGDFICGIHLSDAVLQANPALKVKLELGLSKTYNEALAADKFIGVDQPYEYDVEDMTSAVAVTGPDYYTTVTGAVEVAVQTGDFVKLVTDANLDDNLAVESDLVINLGGNTLAADGKTLTIADSVVTITNGTLLAFTKDNVTLSGNAILTVTDKVVADSFRTEANYYVSQNANGTHSIMLKSAFRVFITMVDGEPRIGFFKDCDTERAPTAYAIKGATNLETPEWADVDYETATDAAAASELPLHWVKPTEGSEFRFFKLSAE